MTRAENKGLLGLELDPLVITHELGLVAARLGDLDERVGTRVTPAAYEGGEVHAGLAEGLGDAHDAPVALSRMCSTASVILMPWLQRLKGIALPNDAM